MAKRTAHEEAIDWMKLAIRQLSLRLQQFTLGVDVDLRHARTAIFGPSGAGKTSLLETIAGCVDQTPQKSRSMVNYSTTAGKTANRVAERSPASGGELAANSSTQN